MWNREKKAYDITQSFSKHKANNSDDLITLKDSFNYTTQSGYNYGDSQIFLNSSEFSPFLNNDLTKALQTPTYYNENIKLFLKYYIKASSVTEQVSLNFKLRFDYFDENNIYISSSNTKDIINDADLIDMEVLGINMDYPENTKYIFLSMKNVALNDLKIEFSHAIGDFKLSSNVGISNEKIYVLLGGVRGVPNPDLDDYFLNDGSNPITGNINMNKNNINNVKLLKNDDTTNNIITIQGDKQTYRGLIDPTHERAANLIVENTIPKNQNLNNNTILQIKNPNFLSSGGPNQITGACMLDFNQALSDFWNGGGTSAQGNVIASARIENRSTRLNNYEASDLVFHVCGDGGTVDGGAGGVLEEFLVMRGKSGPSTTDGIYAYKNINLENDNSLILGYYNTDNAPLKINNGQPGVLNNKSQIAFGFDNTGRLPHYITTRHNSASSVNNSIDFYTADGSNDNNLPQLNSTLNLSLNNGQIGIKKSDPQRDLDCNGTSIFRGKIDAIATLDMNNNNIEDINTLVWNNNEGRMIGTPEGLYIQTPQTTGDKKINFSEFQDSDIRFQIDIDNSKINAYNPLDMQDNRITFNEGDGSFILNDPATGSENMAMYSKGSFIAVDENRVYTNRKLDMQNNSIYFNTTDDTYINNSTGNASTNYIGLNNGTASNLRVYNDRTEVNGDFYIDADNSGNNEFSFYNTTGSSTFKIGSINTAGQENEILFINGGFLTSSITSTFDDTTPANETLEFKHNNNTFTMSSAQSDFNNDVYINGSLVSTSDLRLKENIKQLENSKDKINMLNPIDYKFKDKEGNHKGFIAQEVEEIYPELVKTNKDGYKSISLIELIAPLTENIKYLNKRVKELENKIKTLTSPE